MRAWLVLVAAVAFGLAPIVTEGFAGFRPDQFPIPQENAPVQPAGYAFSIWSVIYLWLLVSAVLGVWRYSDDAEWEDARLPLAISLGLGSVWIKVATLSVLWATALIWVMLLTSLWAFLTARKAEPRWALLLPVGLYAGWLTAASLVSVGLTGAGYGLWLSAPQWATAMLLAAFVAGAALARANPAAWSYPAALSWATFAIAVANQYDNLAIALLALAIAVVFAALTVLQLRGR